MVSHHSQLFVATPRHRDRRICETFADNVYDSGAVGTVVASFSAETDVLAR